MTAILRVYDVKLSEKGCEDLAKIMGMHSS